MNPHQFVYRPGTFGMARWGLADADPFWACTCGEFFFRARAMPHRKTGNNEIEAKRAWEVHVGPVN